MDVAELTKSLAEYNSTVNDMAMSIAKATQPMALIIIGICFLIEMDSWWRYMKQEGTGLTSELWLEVAFKYVLAYFLVMMSSQIFDAMLELTNMIIKGINHILPQVNESFNVDLGKINGWFIKQVLKFIGGGVSYIAKLSTKLIVMMRAFQMYVLKACGPLLVAFFMSDSTRSIAINLLKMFGATAFQGVLVFIIIRIYPAIVTSDLLSVNMSGTFESWMTALSSIAKGVIFIFMLFGSQKLAKSLIGSM
ncbi:hypothetical protein [Streptococcus dysgalactiae]|uniref:hypothetical protein n=1 Tax=Streptococcus dysgalactiae TaxID=1334 RepID=UPI0012A961FC|nr:hypothetical protein [Streptococcus dysgalactiae]QGH04081.1 hypothetical protein EA458_06175 [Streptococcus dysgalactiae subsp. dysgalactiae]